MENVGVTITEWVAGPPRDEPLSDLDAELSNPVLELVGSFVDPQLGPELSAEVLDEDEHSEVEQEQGSIVNADGGLNAEPVVNLNAEHAVNQPLVPMANAAAEPPDNCSRPISNCENRFYIIVTLVIAAAGTATGMYVALALKK